MAVVGLVEERLDFEPVLASFEVSVAMDDCDSASFVLAYPSCRVRSEIFLTYLPPCRDQIGLLWQDLPRHGCGLASSLRTWWSFLNLVCSTVHNLHVELV